MNPKIIVVIPARRGNKKIKKNLRLLDGKPLIFYSIDAAKKSMIFDEIVVSTEDEEIKKISEGYGVKVIDRPIELCGDEIPLDPVVHHAVQTIEEKNKTKYDIVVIFEPTSPLIKPETIRKTIEEFIEKDADTLITARDVTTLFWTKKDNKIIPMYKERVNRQYLDPVYKEIGFVISKRDIIKENQRIGNNIHVFEILQDEALDIDDETGFMLADSIIKIRRQEENDKKRIEKANNKAPSQSRYKTKPKIIGIIPAKGISKRISRKNIKLLNNKPLIFYIIDAAKKSMIFDEIVVSTEDEEIKKISEGYGVKVIDRPIELCEDDVTIDPVIYHAVQESEEKNNIKYDIVAILQPTVPLIKPETIKKAIEEFIEKDNDTMIIVKDTTALFWTEKDNEIIPMYKERVNRQYLAPVYKETGLFISIREVITKNNKIGNNLHVFVIPKEEAIDVDDELDFTFAETVIKKRVEEEKS